MIEVRVDSMMKDFQEEVEPTTDVAPLFRADKSFRCGRHPPSVPLAMEHHTDAESGTTTAWALMVQDPKVIAEPMADQKHPAKDLYTRFRASQAFAELKDEVRRFKEFKSKNRKMFQSWDH
jgi:hypothetical protein